MIRSFGWPELGLSLTALVLLPPPFNKLGALAVLAPAVLSWLQP